MIKADVLVIGSGISGLSYAIKVSEQHPDAKIIIVTKSDEDESNTKYAIRRSRCCRYRFSK